MSTDLFLTAHMHELIVDITRLAFLLVDHAGQQGQVGKVGLRSRKCFTDR